MNDHHYEKYDDIAATAASTPFADLTESIIDTHSAVKVLAVTVTAEIVAFAMYYVSKDKVLEFLADPQNGAFWVYASIGVFLIGFLTAFSIYRLAAKKWPHYGAGIFIWLASFAAGACNVFLFYVLTAFKIR